MNTLIASLIETAASFLMTELEKKYGSKVSMLEATVAALLQQQQTQQVVQQPTEPSSNASSGS